MATNRLFMLQVLRQQSAEMLAMLAAEHGIPADQGYDELAYELSAAMATPIKAAPKQITAREAVPGTTVYVSVAQGGRAAGVREHAVVVGEWRPSVSCGAGWAELIDVHGKFWTVAAADDLFCVEPLGGRAAPSLLGQL